MANTELSPMNVAILEELLDQHGVQAILEALSDICGEKAAHIRTNWQDENLARVWDNACGRLGVTVCSREMMELSHY